MFIKETMLLLAPCYYLMNLENAGLRAQQNLQRMFLQSRSNASALELT